MNHTLILEFAVDPTREAVYAQATQSFSVVYVTHQTPTRCDYAWERIPCHGWHVGALGFHWWRALTDCLAWKPAQWWIAVMPRWRVVPFLLHWAKREGAQIEIWSASDQTGLHHVLHAARRIGVLLYPCTLKEGLIKLSASLGERSELTA